MEVNHNDIKVAVVILNWNGKKWLEKFLPKVIAFSSDEQTKIIVADNQSTDDSIAFLQTHFPSVGIIETGGNYGFAGGYNKALKKIKATYYVLLNSDIEVTENWLKPVIQRMDNNPKMAACQPKILDYNKPNYFEYAGACGGFIDFLGYPFCRGRIFQQLEEDKGQYNTAKAVFWATGACMFVRSDAYWQVNGLDDDFFAHMEEIDFCWRLQNADFEVWVEPASTVYHVGGGTLPKNNPRKTFLNFRNNLTMLIKNMVWYRLIWIFPLRLILDGVAGLQMLINGTFKDFFALIKAHFALHFSLISLLKKRRNNKTFKELKALKGLYRRSIIWQHFVKKTNRFFELKS